MLSIVIPTLNEEKYLPTILNDLRNQTYQDFEVIVVDANSTDKTVEVAKSFRKYFEIQVLPAEIKNAGAQRNQGARKTRGDWLVFVDADVSIAPDLLEKVVDKIKLNEAEFFTIYLKPYPNKRIYRFITRITCLYTEIMAKTKKPLVIESFFCCNRQTFLKLGGFDPKKSVHEGSLFVENAVSKGVRFIVYSDLHFTFHMRRIEQTGVVASAIRIPQIDIAHMLGKSVSDKRLEKLYPMDDRFR